MAKSHVGIFSALYRKNATDGGAGVRYEIEQSEFFARAAEAERVKAKSAADYHEAFRRAAIYPWASIPVEEVDPREIGLINEEQRRLLILDEKTELRRTGPRVLKRP